MMHLDLSSTLNLISTLAIVGALVFAGLQVRQANQSRHDQAAVTVIQTSLSENSAHVLSLLSEIPENAPASVIESFDSEKQRVLLEFGLRLEIIGYMVYRRLVDVKMVNDLDGGVVIAYWSRAKAWAQRRRQQTGYDEFLEWCQWLAVKIEQRRAADAYKPAYVEHRAWRE
jgi:hypothetical protein